MAIKNKDWKGNSVSYSKTIGASSHSDKDREINDFYATEPKAVRLLLELENFDYNIWECACGEGHLSEEMIKLGYNVFSSDKYERIYCSNKIDFLDFNSQNNLPFVDKFDIITNPPYKYANDFIEKGLSILKEGNKMALFLPIRYLEGKTRKNLFKQNPPKKILVSSCRLKCAINGDFENVKSSAMCYAWFIWEKGNKELPIIDWFN